MSDMSLTPKYFLSRPADTRLAYVFGVFLKELDLLATPPVFVFFRLCYWPVERRVMNRCV